MKRLRDLQIGTKLNLLLTGLLIALFTLLGIFIYRQQKNELQEITKEDMQQEIEDLSHIINMQLDENQEDVNNYLNLARYLFSQYGQMNESDSELVRYRAIDQLSLDVHDQEVPLWRLGETPIQNHFEVVDKIQDITGATATIFQKIPQGYLRVSTNVLKNDGERATGTYIPNQSMVIKTIESGQTYTGRAFVVNKWYLTAYEPFLVGDEIKGILYVGVPELDLERIRDIFLEKQYMESGYAYLVASNGDVLIHPEISGENVSSTKLLAHFNNYKDQLVHEHHYLWPENEDGVEKTAYFTYIKRLDSYVAITYPDSELTDQLTDMRNMLIVGVLVSILLVVLLVFMITRDIRKNILKLQKNIEQMANGVLVDTIASDRKDEIGKITDSLNKLTDGLKQTSQFSKDIGQGNLDAEFTPLSNEDLLGNSLLEMRDSLRKANQEEEKRKEEDRKRNWATEGLAKFGDILRQNNENSESLGVEVITNLVNYVEANQGGLFMLNDEDGENLHLELLAAYAYDRRKYLEKKIEMGEGLVGTCAIEKKTVYMTDVPNNYVEITSGLGGANPNCLLIVPLKVEEDLFGVIELASFKAFEPYVIDFVEKIGQNIASTLSSVKINQKTAQLLEHSQQQQEEMQAQEEEMRQNLEELQATQEEMQRKEQEMSGLFNAIDNTVGMYVLGMDKKYNSANNIYLTFIHKDQEEVVGKLHQSIVAENFATPDQYNEIWRKLGNNENYRGEFSYSVNGEKVHLYESYTPMKDSEGNITKVLVLVNNITENKRFRKELEEKDQKQQQMIDELNAENQAKVAEAQKQKEEVEKLLEDQMLKSAKLSAAERALEDNKKAQKLKENRLKKQIEELKAKQGEE